MVVDFPGSNRSASAERPRLHRDSDATEILWPCALPRQSAVRDRLTAARFLLCTAVRSFGTASRLGDHRGRIDRGCFGLGGGFGHFARSRAAARPTHLTTIGVLDAANRLSDRRWHRLRRRILAAKSAGRWFRHSDQAAGLWNPATIGVRNAALRLNGRHVVRGRSLG